MAYITQAAWGRKHNFTRQYVNKLVNNGTIKLHNGKVNEETRRYGYRRYPPAYENQ